MVYFVMEYNGNVPIYTKWYFCKVNNNRKMVIFAHKKYSQKKTSRQKRIFWPEIQTGFPLVGGGDGSKHE